MMKENNLFITGALATVLLLSGCADDNYYTINPPAVTITSNSGSFEVAQEDTLVLTANVKDADKMAYAWILDGKQVSNERTFAYIPTERGDYGITLTVTGEQGEKTITSSIINVCGKYKHGTFVLNEGSTNGSLTFISPKGKVTENAYEKENGTKLGKYTQDLYIHNGKLYIISQNGGNDGMLVIADAETLQRIASYQTDLADSLKMPTHLAVTDDDNIYIRDNRGIWHFKPSSRRLTFVKNSENAIKNRMAVVKNKVFFGVNSETKGALYFIAAGDDQVFVNGSTAMGTIAGITNLTPISGLVQSEDDNLWVAGRGTVQLELGQAATDVGMIVKVDAVFNSALHRSLVTDADAMEALTPSFAATPSITAKGDTIYISNVSGTKIFRHLYETEETKLMTDTKNFIPEGGAFYNTVAVNPGTGEVWANILKNSWPDAAVNHIAVFDFGGEQPKLNADYQNYTQYPAGIFFTSYFK